MIDSTTININAEMLNLVAELNEFKGRWELFGRLGSDVLDRLRQVALIESAGSATRLAGVGLSDYEVEVLASGMKESSFRSRGENEVMDYIEALKTVYDSGEHIPLTENHIKMLHGILLRNSSENISQSGVYRKAPKLHSASPDRKSPMDDPSALIVPADIASCMAELVQWTSFALSQRELHPLLVIAVFNIRFQVLHPFPDGNARLSMVLTHLLLFHGGYPYIKYNSLERVFEGSKGDYYRAMRASQSNIGTEEENFTDWVLFFLRCLKKQKDDLFRKVEQERSVNPLPPLSERILFLTKERGRLSITDAVIILAINRNTAKIHLRQLVKERYLNQHGKGKGTWYTIGK